MKRVLKRAAIGGILLIAGYALGIIVYGHSHEARASDIALVFGNTVYPDGRLSARLKGRVDRAIELFREGLVGAIVVSGGTGKEGVDEAVAMQKYCHSKGVERAKIIVDSRGANTFLSLKNVTRLMKENDYHSVVVVSQYFHLPRVLLASQRLGFEEVSATHARYYELRDIYSLFREMVALPYYALFK